MGTQSIWQNENVLVSTLNGATPAVGTAGVAITAASEAHALNATFSDVEVETALNALGAKINLLITRMEAYGMLAAN